MNDVASATRRPCCSRSSAGPISGAMTANGAMVISRYSATLPLLSPEAAAKNSVSASATAIAASTAKFATTGHVSAVSPDLSAPSAVAARCTRPYIFEPISRLRCAAALVTVTRSARPGADGVRRRPGVCGRAGSSSGGSHRLALGVGFDRRAGGSRHRRGRWGSWPSPGVRRRRRRAGEAGSSEPHADPPSPCRHDAVRSHKRFSPIAATAGVQPTGVATCSSLRQNQWRWTA